MFYFPPTTIFRHRRENLKKCTLRPLETRKDFQFFTYPKDSLPDLSNYFLLTLDAPVISQDDAHLGIFLLDGTWRYVEKMATRLPSNLQKRSLPPNWKTAYPRRQDDCFDPARGLASIEALFVAYQLLGRTCDGLIDNYYWKDLFLQLNRQLTYGL